MFEGLEKRILLDVVPVAVIQTAAVRSPAAPGTYHTVGTADSFTLPTFDDLDGARTLRKATLSVTLTLHDGIYKFDNESPIPGTVNLTMEATADTWSYRAPGDPAPAGTFDGLTLTATENGTGTVLRDSDLDGNPDGDMPTFPVPPGWSPPDFEPETGGDAFWLRGREATDPNAATDTETDEVSQAAGDDLTPFIRSLSGPEIQIDFSSFAGYAVGGDNLTGMAIPDPAPSFVVSAYVIYEYVPEPDLRIVKGVIAHEGPGRFTSLPVGPVDFTPPGSAGNRFPAQTIGSTDLAAATVNSNLVLAAPHVGDLVSFAFVVENRGGDTDGAFDIRLRDTIPPGFAIPAGGPNLHISLGNRGAVAFTPMPGFVGPNNEYALFEEYSPDGIELTDPGPGTGVLAAYNPDSPNLGTNILVVTYDLEVVSPLAGLPHVNWVTLPHYTGDDGPGEPNLLAAPLRDPAWVVAPTLYVWDVFDLEGPGPHRPIRPPALLQAPLFSGTADPAATLHVSLYDPRGDLVGSRTVQADAGGNWMADFFDTPLRDEPHHLVIRQTYSPADPLTRAGYNLRTYYAPAVQGGTFVSEHLTVENVAGRRTASAALANFYTAACYPILLGWNAWSFEFLCAPATPAGR